MAKGAISSLATAKIFFRMHTSTNKHVVHGKLESAIVSENGDIYINHPDPVALKAAMGKTVLYQVIPVKGDIFKKVENPKEVQPNE